MRLAIGRPHGYRWTAIKVFTALNMPVVKHEIERNFPLIAKTGKGHFKHYPKYKSICFNALTKKEKGTYDAMAVKWNDEGPPEHVREACRKGQLAN